MAPTTHKKEVQVAKKLVLLGGATASGKSALALRLASGLAGMESSEDWGLEFPEALRSCALTWVHVLNADCMQLYRDIPSLTARPLSWPAYVSHGLYGILNPQERMSIHAWATLLQRELTWAEATNRLPIVVGGTGFYLQIFFDGLPGTPIIPPELLHAVEEECSSMNTEEMAHFYRLPQKDKYRMLRDLALFRMTGRRPEQYGRIPMPSLEKYQLIPIYLDCPLQQLERRIAERLWKIQPKQIFSEIEAMGEVGKGAAIMRVLGLQAWMEARAGVISVSQAREMTCRSSRQYAKRQRTFFKKYFQPAHRVPCLF